MIVFDEELVSDPASSSSRFDPLGPAADATLPLPRAHDALLRAMRPREKLFARGAAHLSRVELLALLVGAGARGEAPAKTADRLLRRHGLRALAALDPEGFRILTGLGVGGEWATGQTLVGETFPSQVRARFAAIMQTGAPVGIALATVVGAFVEPIFAESFGLSWGWRACFFVSVLPAVLVIAIRQFMPESDVWEEWQRHPERREATGNNFSVFLWRIARSVASFCSGSSWRSPTCRRTGSRIPGCPGISTKSSTSPWPTRDSGCS